MRSLPKWHPDRFPSSVLHPSPHAVGTNAVFTLSIGGGPTSAPYRRVHHGDAIQNCRTCEKAHFNDKRESTGGGALPSLIFYQGTARDTNVISGSTNVVGSWDPLGPSEIAFSWFLTRKAR